ncbi:MAG: PTS sugar transporter subunit IIA, partial [Elusimicrobia bacterium]|nr:PTS sugar transporter subunit IIA [Elusimicrobiota bacterium]
MDLNVRDAAKVFGVSEPTILRWVKQEGMPSFAINGRYRFNRVDLLEWSHARKHPMAAGAKRGGNFELLIGALNAGGVHYSVAGADAASALAAAAARLPLSAADRALAAEVLVEREKHGATAIGDGIAIPHPRGPLVFPVAAPVAALCFLERPLDFGAADGKPVGTLFLLLAPGVRSHLALLAELSAALHD